MACINDVRLVGRLVDDVKITNLRDKSKMVRAQVETYRPVKDRLSGKTKWLSQIHTVNCFRSELVSVLENHGKKGRFVKVFGELTYDRQGRAEVVVGAFGEFGMMNSVPAEAPADKETSEQGESKQSAGTGRGGQAAPKQQKQGAALSAAKNGDRSFGDDSPADDDHDDGPRELSWNSTGGHHRAKTQADNSEIPF